MATAMRTESVRIPSGGRFVEGDLRVPPNPRGLVLFAPGSGSSRFGRRNRQVASFLEHQGFATLLLDLLTPEEEAIDERTAEFRFDIARLADRVIAAIDWLGDRPDVRSHPICCVGASTGAAAALIAAVQRPGHVRAVVSRGGRPDLAASALAHVRAPTLLIVGGLDGAVIDMNRSAMARMPGTVELSIVPGATLFEEPGTLDQVCKLAGQWCATHLVGAGVSPRDARRPIPHRADTPR